MKDYISELAEAICAAVPEDHRPRSGDDLRLFRLYAVLARAKGVAVTAEDVHDAWSAWMGDRQSAHPALVPYAQLNPEQQRQDVPFLQAIAAVAKTLNRT